MQHVIIAIYRPISNPSAVVHWCASLPLSSHVGIFFQRGSFVSFIYKLPTTVLCFLKNNRKTVFTSMLFYTVTLFYCILIFNDFIFIYLACKTRAIVTCFFIEGNLT